MSEQVERFTLCDGSGALVVYADDYDALAQRCRDWELNHAMLRDELESEQQSVAAFRKERDALAQRCAELEVESESLACNLRGKHATAGATYRHLVNDRDALRAEVETLRKDAERYRYLRDQQAMPDGLHAVMRWNGEAGEWRHPDWKLDIEIDAALRGKA